MAPEFIPRKYREMGIVPGAVKIENSLPKEVFPLPVPIHDYRLYPSLIYPQQPRPFLFNIPPAVPSVVPATVAQIPPLNSVPQPVRVGNPIVVAPRLIPPVSQPMQLPKNGPVTDTPTPTKTLPPKPAVVQSNNRLIQFLNNVHFPEASVLNDCINLLPQNMCLADMLLQPPILQERWYNYLKESTGLEAAEKFKYLLFTTNQKGTKVFDKSLFERSTPQPCESPTFNWYDSPTNQINFNKPVYMTENIPNDSRSRSRQNGLVYKWDPQFVKKVSNSAPNGLSSNMTETEIQRHINEEFANLNVAGSDINEVFAALTVKSESLRVGAQKVSGPRFYKYFH